MLPLAIFCSVTLLMLSASSLLVSDSDHLTLHSCQVGIVSSSESTSDNWFNSCKYCILLNYWFMNNLIGRKIFLSNLSNSCTKIFFFQYFLLTAFSNIRIYCQCLLLKSVIYTCIHDYILINFKMLLVLLYYYIHS